MDLLSRIDARSVALARRVALFAVAGMLCLSGFIAVDVALRGLANAPIYGFVEAAQLIMAVALAACFPGGLAERRHISIEILQRYFGRRGDAVFSAVGHFFLLVFFVILCWRFTLYTIEIGADVTQLLRLPTPPFWWTVTGFLALCIPAQTVTFLVRLREAVDAFRDDGRVGAEGAAARPPWSRTATIWVVVFLVALAVLVWPAFVDRTVAAELPGGRATLALVIFATMWVLSLALVPLGAAMGLAGLAGIASVVGLEPGLSALATQCADLLSNINLAVIPLFLLMGSFAATAGLAADIYSLAHALLRHWPGGLAMATVGGCAGFGAVTGSSVATVATIGRVAFPEMQSRGYAARLSTGCIAAGGTLGTLVPPSGTMVLYAILTEVSVGQMFIAALIPAALAVAFYFVVIWLLVRFSPEVAPRSDRASLGEIWEAFKRCAAVFVLFGAVIGGLYVGAFTPTEAAAVGAVGAFLMAAWRGKLGGGAFWDVMGETAATSAMIFLLIMGGFTFSFFIGLTQLPETMTLFFETLNVAPIVVIFGLLAIFVLLGAVMDPHGILVITVPIVAPLILGFGYDLVWWGLLMIVVVEIGVVTPPIGINVFVMKGVAPGVPLTTVFRGIAPFCAADIVRLIVLTLFPGLILYLPATMR